MVGRYGNDRGLGYGPESARRVQEYGEADRPSRYQRQEERGERRDLREITEWREDPPAIGHCFQRWINQQDRDCEVVAHGPGGRYAYVWDYGEDSQSAREREKIGQVDQFVRIGGGKLPKYGGVGASEVTCSRKRLPKWAHGIRFEVETELDTKRRLDALLERIFPPHLALKEWP